MIRFYILVGIVTVPCSLKSCANNALCVFKSGTVECRCPDVSDCPTVSNPVCGSDGAIHKVYSNKCLMEVESCKKGKRIRRVPSDKCGKLLSLPFFTLSYRNPPPSPLCRSQNSLVVIGLKSHITPSSFASLSYSSSLSSNSLSLQSSSQPSRSYR